MVLNMHILAKALSGQLNSYLSKKDQGYFWMGIRSIFREHSAAITERAKRKGKNSDKIKPIA
jgi:hypothetical protein